MNIRERRRREFEAELAPVKDVLMAYTRHLLRQKTDLPDAMQAILLTAFRRFDQFRPGTSFKAWVFQVATYEIYNLNRRNSREWSIRVPWDEALAEGAPAEMDPLMELARETTYNQLLRDPMLLSRALDGELQSALMSLTPNERSVLLLRIVGGFSTSEASQILSMPAGSVMGFLGRARRKLRLALGDYAVKAGLIRKPNEESRR